MRGLFAIVVALAGCIPPQSTGCPTGSTLCGPRPERIEMVRRDHFMTEEAAVEGVGVRTAPFGAAGWRVTIANVTDASMSVLWNESSFVTSKREATGLRGTTRPASPLPPKALVDEVVLVGKFMADERVEARIEKDSSGMDPAKVRDFREGRTRLINGGRLHLVIETSAGKKTWTGLVEASPVQKVN